MKPVALSPETIKRLDLLFHGENWQAAQRIWTFECGRNLPFCESMGSIELERFRYAALKLSGGKIDEFVRAVVIAQEDWRDLLVAAGFGNDFNAHKNWMP